MTSKERKLAANLANAIAPAIKAHGLKFARVEMTHNSEPLVRYRYDENYDFSFVFLDDDLVQPFVDETNGDDGEELTDGLYLSSKEERVELLELIDRAVDAIEQMYSSGEEEFSFRRR